MAVARRSAALAICLLASMATFALTAHADEGPAPAIVDGAGSRSGAGPSPFGGLDLSIAPQEGRSLDDGGSAPPPTPPITPVAPSPPSSAAAPPQATVPAPASEIDAGKLKARAQAALQNGDIAAARSLLVAVGRDPEAERLLAEAWDPAALARLGVVGIAGDASRARDLYDRAAADETRPR